MQRRWLLIALVGFTALAFTAWRAMTFAPAHQPVTVGLVDMEKLVANYKALQEDDQRFKQLIARRRKMVEVRVLLEPKEWEELSALEQKEEQEKLTEAERKRIDELRKLTEQRQAEMERLRIKGQLSEDERKRLEYLQNLQRSNQERLQKMVSEIDKELGELNDIITRDHAKKIREAAKQVAQQSELRLVLVADQDLVLYSEPTLDVTDKVLEILNAGK